jgi:hypothetical protein
MPTEKLDFGGKVNTVKAVQPPEKSRAFPFNPVFADIYIEDGTGGTDEDDRRKKGSEEIIGVRETDPVQELFGRMRRLSAEVCRDAISAEHFRESIFFKQAQFMADFEDDYQKFARFSMYYPYYQMMSYEQLRTYFTWRKYVRLRDVRQTDLSYVFLYIYELINNIGVASGSDGMEKLLFIWRECRRFSNMLDRYMPLWLRDYCIINDCPFEFSSLLESEPLLKDNFPEVSDKYTFDFYSDLSPYKIKQSIFYTAENERKIEDCFNHIIERLNGLLIKAGLSFNDLIYDRTAENRWQPFAGAIFYMRPEYLPKSEKTVKINGNCIFTYRNGRWTYIKNEAVTPVGKAVLGYIFKRMEQLLRRAYKFKYKLSINDRNIDRQFIDKLLPETGCGGFLTEIDAAVKDFYLSSKRTVVKVDEGSLEKIRQSALITQEKLTVAEISGADLQEPMIISEEPASPVTETVILVTEPDISPVKTQEFQDVWSGFAASLELYEATAVKKILEGASLRAMNDYARENGLMLEVLLDNINNKALDACGDTIMEINDEITVYDDYTEYLRKVFYD